MRFPVDRESVREQDVHGHGITLQALSMPQSSTHGMYRIYLPQCVRLPDPLTDAPITIQCVFDVDFATGLRLVDSTDGVTIDEVRSKTEADFRVADDVKPML